MDAGSTGCESRLTFAGLRFPRSRLHIRVVRDAVAMANGGIGSLALECVGRDI